jgi:hypothetical protein
VATSLMLTKPKAVRHNKLGEPCRTRRCQKLPVDAKTRLIAMNGGQTIGAYCKELLTTLPFIHRCSLECISSMSSDSSMEVHE